MQRSLSLSSSVLLASASPQVTLVFLMLAWTLVCTSPAADAQQPQPPYPDVQEMIREPLDNVTNGTIACGWNALRYRMRGNIYQSNPGRLDNPRLTQFERLVKGDPEDVAAVNREIIAYCEGKKAEIEAAWRDPKRRHPAKEVCQYQTELIPLAILSLRIGERLTPEAHQAIKDVLTAFRPETADVEPTLWMHAPGYNGANAHDYLSFLAMTWAVTVHGSVLGIDHSPPAGPPIQPPEHSHLLGSSIRTPPGAVVRPGQTLTTPDFVRPRKTKPARATEVIETPTCHHVFNRDPQLDSTASPPRARSLAGWLRVITTRTTPVKISVGNAYPQKNVKREGVSASPHTTENRTAISQPSRPGRPGCAATWPATATEN